MKKISVLLFVFLLAFRSFASDLLSAKIYTVPEQPYVGQEASLFVDIVTTGEADIRNATVFGFPATNYAFVGQLATLPVVETRDAAGRSCNLHRLRAPIRADHPVDCDVRPVIQLEIVRVVSFLFSSSRMSHLERINADCQRLVTRALPEEGRPADYAGAVGDFSLDLKANPSTVWTNDIVNLTLTLHGTGYAGKTPPSMPALEKNLFRAYGSKDISGEDGPACRLGQTIIPLSTQAVEIAAARFPYFDPVDGRYKTAMSEPVRLLFRERKAGAVPAVREVKVQATQEESRPVQALEVTGATLRTVSKALTPVLIALFTGLFILACARAFGMRYRYASLIGLLVFVLVYLFARQRQMSRSPAQWMTTGPVVMRLAPSGNARALLELPAEMAVDPLEKNGDWVHVRSQGQAGWIRSSAVRNLLPASR